MGFKKILLWNGISQIGQSGIQFLSTVILARILTPDDFAIIGMVTIFIVLGSMMVDSQMGGALLRKDEVLRIDYSTLFFYNLVVSIFIYILLYFVAPIISSFYHRPVLTSVIRIICIVIVIHAFRVVQQVMIFRELNFKIFAIISVSSGVISLGIAIIMAYHGFGYWALVWQNIISALLNVLLMSLYNKFIPSFTFSTQSFKEQFGFGISLLGSDSLKTLANNISLNIIAKFAPLNVTGNYTQYMRITSFSQNFIGSLMNQSIFPSMAKIREFDLLTVISKKFFYSIICLTGCITIIMGAFSIPIIRVLLGEKWESESWIFQILCLTIYPISIQILNTNILKAVGRTRIVLKIELIKSIIILSLLGLAIVMGLKYIIWSVAISQSIASIYSMVQILISTKIYTSKEVVAFIMISLCLYIIIYNYINT